MEIGKIITDVEIVPIDELQTTGAPNAPAERTPADVGAPAS